MSEQYSTHRMLALRKLTRASADLMRNQLKDSLSAVVPLLQPKTSLGDYVRGVKDTTRGADSLFKEVQALYESVSKEKPFGLRRELTHPIDIAGLSVDLQPLEYGFSASSNGQKKNVVVTSPFRWVVTYSGHSLEKLRALLALVSPSNEELHAFILHFVILRTLVGRSAPLANLFRALRYRVDFETQPEFGGLPLTCISAPISTIRPPDDVIIETTEMTGSNTFEEVIDLSALVALRDPLKDDLIELAKAHGEKI